jgi:ABC-type uncharacterized transport system substrate-binding protein
MRRWRIQIAIVIVCILLWQFPAFSADKGNFKTTPKLNNGKKWQIGYYEGGPFINYQENLEATFKGLMNLGWIEKKEIPPQKGEQTKDLWAWAGANLKSNYLIFVKDGHYSADWDKEARKKLAAAIIKRLNDKKDIDLIIAMGTWAGKDIANDQHKTPTIVLSTSDPISAKIIKSVEDSGYDNVHARVEPYRWERQIKIFHDAIGFNKLGVAYEDTVDGKSYTGITDIEKVAKTRDFEIVRCYTKSDVADIKIAEESVKTCYQELVKKADAIYVTLQGGINKNSIPDLVEIVNNNRIPTFAQSGSEQVRYGFFMSMAKANYQYFGDFYAETIAKIFNGAKPRQIGQVFEAPIKIAINLKTAEKIEFDIPIDILGIADEIYQEIETPK